MLIWNIMNNMCKILFIPFWIKKWFLYFILIFTWISSFVAPFIVIFRHVIGTLWVMVLIRGLGVVKHTTTITTQYFVHAVNLIFSKFIWNVWHSQAICGEVLYNWQRYSIFKLILGLAFSFTREFGGYYTLFSIYIHSIYVYFQIRIIFSQTIYILKYF